MQHQQSLDDKSSTTKPTTRDYEVGVFAFYYGVHGSTINGELTAVAILRSGKHRAVSKVVEDMRREGLTAGGR
jgi:hypothetical protein